MSITLRSGRSDALALDGAHRHWPETNCSVDLWLTALEAWGEQPLALPGFTIAIDFEGDQFTFLKPPAADLEALYGIGLEELQVYRDLERHLAVQLGRGAMPIIEVDTFWLPDTRGTGYRADHAKTTIGVTAIDPCARRLSYLHNRAHGVLDAEDYDGVLWRHPAPPPGWLPPYAEIARRARGCAHADEAALADVALAILRRHLRRVPSRDPIRAFGETFGAEVMAQRDGDPASFHRWAFATLRQLGAAFELLRVHAAWLGAATGRGAGDAPLLCDEIAGAAKTLQFRAARAIARGDVGGDCVSLIEGLSRSREAVIGALTSRFA